MSSAETSIADLMSKLGKDSGAKPELLSELAGMLQGENGLSGLIEQFKQSGLGEMVISWVGTGENKPISDEQMRKALGSDKINSMAAQLGLSPEVLSGQLSKVLPQLIDKLTPDGKLPEGGWLEQGLIMLRRAVK